MLPASHVCALMFQAPHISHAQVHSFVSPAGIQPLVHGPGFPPSQTSVPLIIPSPQPVQTPAPLQVCVPGQGASVHVQVIGEVVVISQCFLLIPSHL